MAEEDARAAAELFRKDSTDFDSAITLVGGTVQRAKALFEPSPVRCRGGTIDPLKAYKIALAPVHLAIKTVENQYFPGGNYAPDKAVVLRERKFDHFNLCVNDEVQVKDICGWCDHLVATCEQALGAGARFVIFPELSYPNFWPGGRPSELEGTDRRRQLNNARAKLDEKLQELASKYE
jgi:hypothetical protein